MQEILCPDCGQWAIETAWKDCEVPCDLCGDHPALECPHCPAVFDTVITILERRGE